MSRVFWENPQPFTASLTGDLQLSISGFDFNFSGSDYAGFDDLFARAPFEIPFDYAGYPAGKEPRQIALDLRVICHSDNVISSNETARGLPVSGWIELYDETNVYWRWNFSLAETVFAPRGSSGSNSPQSGFSSSIVSQGEAITRPDAGAFALNGTWPLTQQTQLNLLLKSPAVALYVPPNVKSRAQITVHRQLTLTGNGQPRQYWYSISLPGSPAISPSHIALSNKHHIAQDYTSVELYGGLGIGSSARIEAYLEGNGLSDKQAEIFWQNGAGQWQTEAFSNIEQDSNFFSKIFFLDFEQPVPRFVYLCYVGVAGATTWARALVQWDNAQTLMLYNPFSTLGYSIRGSVGGFGQLRDGRAYVFEGSNARNLLIWNAANPQTTGNPNTQMKIWNDPDIVWATMAVSPSSGTGFSVAYILTDVENLSGELVFKAAREPFSIESWPDDAEAVVVDSTELLKRGTFQFWLMGVFEDKSGTLYISNGNGGYISRDGGENWENFS